MFQVGVSFRGFSRQGAGDEDGTLIFCMPTPSELSSIKVLLLTRQEYLFVGNLSDLTLAFGEKTLQIHRALACSHSI
jgi:hypothetical protein